VRPASPGPRRRGEEAQAEAACTVPQLFLHGRQVPWLFYHVRLALRARLRPQVGHLSRMRSPGGLRRIVVRRRVCAPVLDRTPLSRGSTCPCRASRLTCVYSIPCHASFLVVLCLLLVIDPPFVAGFARRQHDGVQPRTDGRPVWWLHASVVPANGREGAAH